MSCLVGRHDKDAVNVRNYGNIVLANENGRLPYNFKDIMQYCN